MKTCYYLADHFPRSFQQLIYRFQHPFSVFFSFCCLLTNNALFLQISKINFILTPIKKSEISKIEAFHVGFPRIVAVVFIGSSFDFVPVDLVVWDLGFDESHSFQPFFSSGEGV